ncbi:hypothetical protein PDB1_05825 [Pseudomonas aeruginosa]
MSTSGGLSGLPVCRGGCRPGARKVCPSAMHSSAAFNVSRGLRLLRYAEAPLRRTALASNGALNTE